MGYRLDARPIAEQHDEYLANGFRQFSKTALSTILTGDDSGSAHYQRALSRTCARLGVRHWRSHPRTDQELLDAIDLANTHRSIDGVLLFHPLASGISLDRYALANRIAPSKDVEGLGITRQGMLAQRYEIGGVRNGGIYPSTPEAILELLRAYDFAFDGVATVLNRSDVVGKPLRTMLESMGMTVLAAFEQTDQAFVENALSVSRLVVTAVPDESYRLPASALRRDATVVAVTPSNLGDAARVRCSEYCDNIGVLTQRVLFGNLLALRQTHRSRKRK